MNEFNLRLLVTGSPDQKSARAFALSGSYVMSGKLLMRASPALSERRLRPAFAHLRQAGGGQRPVQAQSGHAAVGEDVEADEVAGGGGGDPEPVRRVRQQRGPLQERMPR